jgi:small subunit ribosomal protein S1
MTWRVLRQAWWTPTKKLRPQQTLKAGDILLGLPSSGPHSNGYSLIRKVFSKNEWRKYAKELLAPTRLYVRPILKAIKNVNKGGHWAIKGLVHVTELSWTKRIAKPSDVLKVGQEIEAVVIDVNPTTEKMALGLKQLTEDPIAKFAPGATVEGKVVRLTDQGAFLELAPDIEGFVHISEIPSDHRLNHAGEVLKEGETVTGLVLKGQRKSRRIELSIRKHDQREERQLLKRYRPSGEGVTLGDVTEWGSADESAAGEPPASDSPTPNA